jgi:hypothetical protein
MSSLAGTLSAACAEKAKAARRQTKIRIPACRKRHASRTTALHSCFPLKPL